MPCAAASCAASAAGSCPGSSPSGRLLMIVRTPARASASRSDRSNRPDTLNPGPSGTSCGAMPLLHACLPGDLQAAAPASRKKSGGELRRPLHQVAGTDPEALEPAEGGADSLEVFHVERGLRKQLLVALMHHTHTIP